jgi:hypothetical protein
LKRTRVSTTFKRSDGFFDEAGLHQNAPSDGDDRVGRQHIGVGNVLVVGDDVPGIFRLRTGKPRDQRARHLALFGRFVDARRPQGIRFYAHLAQQRETAWRGARKHELWLQASSAAIRLGARQFHAQGFPAWIIGAA